MKQRWTTSDRQAFADCKLRALTVPSRRHAGPSADEWDWDDEIPEAGCDTTISPVSFLS